MTIPCIFSREICECGSETDHGFLLVDGKKVLAIGILENENV
ncbi:hypothetical protein [Cylindrospermopsis raciborskii]|nr:hypothetical protein [Cylindrospermopsis raciborskii]